MYLSSHASICNRALDWLKNILNINSINENVSCVEALNAVSNVTCPAQSHFLMGNRHEAAVISWDPILGRKGCFTNVVNDDHCLGSICFLKYYIENLTNLEFIYIIVV